MLLTHMKFVLSKEKCDYKYSIPIWKTKQIQLVVSDERQVNDSQTAKINL